MSLRIDYGRLEPCILSGLSSFGRGVLSMSAMSSSIEVKHDLKLAERLAQRTCWSDTKLRALGFRLASLRGSRNVSNCRCGRGL